MDVDSTITEPGSLGDRDCQSRGTEGEVAASLGGQGGEAAVSFETERKLLPAWEILSLLLGHHDLFHDTLPSMTDRNHLKP